MSRPAWHHAPLLSTLVATVFALPPEERVAACDRGMAWARAVRGMIDNDPALHGDVGGFWSAADGTLFGVWCAVQRMHQGAK